MSENEYRFRRFLFDIMSKALTKVKNVSGGRYNLRNRSESKDNEQISVDFYLWEDKKIFVAVETDFKNGRVISCKFYGFLSYKKSLDEIRQMLDEEQTSNDILYSALDNSSQVVSIIISQTKGLFYRGNSISSIEVPFISFGIIDPTNELKNKWYTCFNEKDGFLRLYDGNKISTSGSPIPTEEIISLIKELDFQALAVKYKEKPTPEQEGLLLNNGNVLIKEYVPGNLTSFISLSLIETTSGRSIKLLDDYTYNCVDYHIITVGEEYIILCYCGIENGTISKIWSNNGEELYSGETTYVDKPNENSTSSSHSVLFAITQLLIDELNAIPEVVELLRTEYLSSQTANMELAKSRLDAPCEVVLTRCIQKIRGSMPDNQRKVLNELLNFVLYLPFNCKNEVLERIIKCIMGTYSK